MGGGRWEGKRVGGREGGKVRYDVINIWRTCTTHLLYEGTARIRYTYIYYGYVQAFKDNCQRSFDLQNTSLASTSVLTSDEDADSG